MSIHRRNYFSEMCDETLHKKSILLEVGNLSYNPNDNTYNLKLLVIKN